MDLLMGVMGMLPEDEGRLDPFKIGVYLIELAIVGLVVYALIVLPGMLRPVT
ncbi:MAG: hypothetical protein QUS08_00360 [Methanothrix sp.]|nr:hypothetical protein [Methanothrix sp.]